MKRALALVAALSAGTLSGCLSTAPPTNEQATFSSLATNVFVGCSTQACHGGPTPSGNMNLEADKAYASLVGAQPTNEQARADGLLRVTAGNPEKSFLVIKLHAITKPAYGAQMPLGGRLSTAQITAIHQWIEKGAPND